MVLSMTLHEDGTYSLKMKKRWDNDFTALAENDVVYGVVNDLASGGGKYYTSWLRVLHVDNFTALAENDVVYGVVNDLASGGGKYYTSWLRVLHVDISANTINAVMYLDSEVPGGKNYPPEPLMILSPGYVSCMLTSQPIRSTL